MRRIARLVIRDTNDDNDGLIIGAKLKIINNPLKKGKVYELQEILDTIVIKEIGDSCIGKNKESSIAPYNWYTNAFSDILEGMKGFFFLTKEEYELEKKLTK